MKQGGGGEEVEVKARSAAGGSAGGRACDLDPILLCKLPLSSRWHLQGSKDRLRAYERYTSPKKRHTPGACGQRAPATLDFCRRALQPNLAPVPKTPALRFGSQGWGASADVTRTG